MQRLRLPNQKAMLGLAAGVIAVLLVAVGIVAWKYHRLQNATTSTQDTTNRLVREVGNIYDLPANEQPTVALVQDKSKLGGQQFFSKAQNGDYILVYSTNKLALIYRERQHKLINVGPISFKQ